jgi:hypothetical protein
MLSMDTLYNMGTGAIILVLIVLANYYQTKTRRRFSGVIGKVMLWYSVGLAAMLAVTIFNWTAYTLQLQLQFIENADRLFDIAAISCFLKGALVIR